MGWSAGVLIALAVTFSVPLSSAPPFRQAGLPVIDLRWHEIAEHIERLVPPVYPEIAARAKIQGVVVLRVLISRSGQVDGVLVMGAAPFLDQAAIEAVRQWRFRPIQILGEAVAVRADVVVPFYLNESNAFRMQMAAFGASEKECRRLLGAQRLDDAEPACTALAIQAGKVDNAMSFVRAEAYHLVGEMLSSRGRPAEALEAFKAEVTLRNAGSPDDLLALAHLSAARAFAETGDLRNAGRSYERAEAAVLSLQKLLRTWKPRPDGDRDLKQGLELNCLNQLSALLTELISFLEKTGQADEARKARQRLESLVKGV